MSATHARQRPSQSTWRHTGWKSRPLVSLGKKYVVFCGMTSPRRARSNTSSMRVARSRKAPSNSPESTRVIASSEIRRVAERLVADEPVDELDVELTRLTDDRERGTPAIADGVGLLVGQTGQPVDRSNSRGGVADACRWQRLLVAPKETVSGEDLEPGVGGRDEHDHHPCTRRRTHLGGVGEGCLVAVVTVGDQQLATGESLGDTGPGDPPEPCVARHEVRLALGHGDGWLAVVEQEDGLELGLCRAEEAQAALLGTCMRPLVGQHRSRLVRLDAERGDETFTPSRDPVGADVVLGDGPDGRLVVLDEHAFVEPRPKQPPGLVLGVVQRQVHDVVGITRPVLGKRFRRHHVVRRCRHVGRGVRVANRAKRGDIGHGPSVPEPA